MLPINFKSFFIISVLLISSVGILQNNAFGDGTDDFAVLASTYTNTAAGTSITGDVGYTTGPEVMPTISGSIHVADSAYSQAGTAQNAAISSANSQACTTNLGATVDLSIVNGGVYTPGVYCTTDAASIGTAGITLSGDGVYIFKINGALTTVVNSDVKLTDGAQASEVSWVPTSAATLGANSDFAGTILDASGVTIGDGASITGKVLAFGGTVSTGPSVTIDISSYSTPEAEAEVGVQVGSSGSSSGESSAKDEGETESETQEKPESKAQVSTDDIDVTSREEVKAESESESETQEKPESKAQVSIGNIDVTSRGEAKAIIGLPAKYPMPSASASNSFVLQTNQHLYKPGDTVMVEGSLWTDLLASRTGDETVTVQVFDRTRNVIYETNAEITTDGTFSTEFALPSVVEKGAYAISSSIQIDTDLPGVDEKVKTNLGASTKMIVVPHQAFKIEVENHGEFDVKVATNSIVNSVKFNGEQKKVSVTVEGQSGTDGVSHISIPKDMMSGDMQVMIDGQVVANDQVVVTKHTEAETEVEVNYQHSIHTIDVIGTQAVPEFGTIAGLILVVSIISIIAVSARSKLTIMPRI